MKFLLVILTTVFSVNVFAGQVFYCTDSQTKGDYVFNIDNQTVTARDSNGIEIKTATVKYTPGLGQDIVYNIVSNGNDYGLVSGEEGYRAKLSLDVFGEAAQVVYLDCTQVERASLESASCTLGSYRLEIGFESASAKTNGVKSSFYDLFRDDVLVSDALNSSIDLTLNEYDEVLLNAHIWVFMSDNNYVAIAIPSPDKSLAPGTYTGAADISVSVGNETMSGGAVPCSITVK